MQNKIVLIGKVTTIAGGEAYLEHPEGLVRIGFLDEIKTWKLKNKSLKVTIEIEDEPVNKEIKDAKV
jgi:hypothetical protein